MAGHRSGWRGPHRRPHPGGEDVGPGRGCGMTTRRPPGASRIAYLVKRFPRLSETFVLDEIVELKRAGVALRLYALMDPGEKLVPPEAAASRPGGHHPPRQRHH